MKELQDCASAVGVIRIHRILLPEPKHDNRFFFSISGILPQLFFSGCRYEWVVTRFDRPGLSYYHSTNNGRICIMVFMSEKRNQRNYSLRQVQYSGRVAVMIMLVLNLTFAMFYRTASAQPSTFDVSIFTQGCHANAFDMRPHIVALSFR